MRAEKNAFVSHNSANLWGGEDVRIAFLNNKTRSPRRVNSALIFFRTVAMFTFFNLFCYICCVILFFNFRILCTRYSFIMSVFVRNKQQAHI